MQPAWVVRVQIVWDEKKRETNRTNRGLDFADIDPSFIYASTVIEAKHGRKMAIGRFRNTILSVVFKPLGSEGISIVSMRLASRKERKLHGEA
jgi:uncharacterized DUF497 family protein